jgi:hypothetical protein
MFVVVGVCPLNGVCPCLVVVGDQPLNGMCPCLSVVGVCPLNGVCPCLFARICPLDSFEGFTP